MLKHSFLRLKRKQKPKKADADALKYQMEQEAAGIEAKGNAEATAIQAKGLAEAEALDKKAEAMKKYGEAAIMEMYFDALPKIAESVAAPLSNVDRITMYGEGNSSKLVGDITKGIDQVIEGINAGSGVDLKSILAGFVGGKAASSSSLASGPSTGHKIVKKEHCILERTE